MSEGLQPRVDITVLVCTYNRCDELRELLATALVQETGGAFSYEVLVVDNNSNDITRGVVESYIAKGHTNLRYLFEGRQGKSYALNTGLSAARGSIYAIADDDFVLPVNYLGGIFEAFRDHPEVSFVGGKVLPLWKGEAPRWMTSRHWSALAIADYGEKEFYSEESNQISLLACAFRLADVKAVGGYHYELGVSKGDIGGTEDAELYARLFKAGRKGLYLPQLWLHHKVEPRRLTKDHHRKWQTGHGRHCAIMRAEEIERSQASLFGVPSHLYNQAAKDALRWLKHTLSGRRDEAFWDEVCLHFFVGFFRKRREDFRAANGHSTAREIASFVRALATGKHLHRSTSKEIG